MNSSEKIHLVCSICKKAPKIVNSYIRMACMCDDEIRTIHLDDINNPEHMWRLYLLNRKADQYAND